MTTPDTFTKTAEAQGGFRLPDPPQREPDEMTQYDQLFKDGDSHALAVHLGSRETTLVEADRWIVVRPEDDKTRARRPDLLVAFGVNPEAYRLSNGYVISVLGKPPDFVLEVASESTGHVDVTEKRVDYARLGIPEYWRFDETGEYHGAKLAGDRLVSGGYVPVEIEELPGEVLQGYSPALNLNLRWAEGKLVFHDPTTGESIASLEGQIARAEAAEAYVETERVRADTQQARADMERQAREAAEARADTEQTRAETAESRVRELEERLRGQGS